MSNASRAICCWFNLTVLLVATIVVGCADQSATNDNSGQKQLHSQGRQYDNVSEFDVSQLVISSTRPVLVEFGMDVNCFRCAQMTQSVNELKNRFDGQAQIVRTSYSPSSAFQSELGLQICPTYLFYNNGQLVDRCDGPTKLPVLMSKLSHLVSSEAGPSAANQPEVLP